MSFWNRLFFYDPLAMHTWLSARRFDSMTFVIYAIVTANVPPQMISRLGFLFVNFPPRTRANFAGFSRQCRSQWQKSGSGGRERVRQTCSP